MKIRKLTFENHFLFGNLHLDFTDKDGETVDTIIIAGENGVGKSLLLEVLFKFTTLSALEKNEKLILEIEVSKAEIEVLNENETANALFKNSIGKSILQISIDFSNPNIWNRMKISNGEKVFSGTVLAQENTRRIFMSIFSSTEINFSPREINSITALDVDKIVKESERSNNNLASEITQLLVDIQSIDATEFSDWGKENKGIPVDTEKIDVRINRFASAFKFIFPSKKYKTIRTKDNMKKVIFEENGREMEINELSSGEKQIVFRGSFLLKNKETTKGALILIDEPEISMHPIWQLKILNFFKKLFTDNSGEQLSQLIIATHSPFIIHNANRKNDKVIVLQKNETGQIIVLEEPKFYEWSSEKIVQEAFNVTHNLDTEKIIVFLEGETDEKYFNKSLEIFGKSDTNLEFRWIGRVTSQGGTENTGDKALNHAKVFITANMDFIKHKIILFYDSDTNKPEEDIQNLIIRKMSKNEDNVLYKKGSENLLILPSNFNSGTFYRQRTKTDDYGAESLIRELDKIRLCEYICNELEVDKQKEVLKKIDEEIERLLNLI